MKMNFLMACACIAVASDISNCKSSAQIAVNLHPAQTLSTPLLARTAEDLPIATDLVARVLARTETVMQFDRLDVPRRQFGNE
jgi:hypothetical protein